MTVEGTTWRVGIIGVSPAGLYLLERLSLTPGIRLIGAYDPDPARLAMADDQGCVLWEQVLTALTSPITDALFFMGTATAEAISMALTNGKHLVIHQPWQLSSNELRDIGKRAKQLKRATTVFCFRRWSADYLAASAAKNSGRLGVLQSVRFSSCEKSIPLGESSAGVLREFGYHWLDQLLQLVDSAPHRVFAKQFLEAGQKRDYGVWTTIEFANGCLAQIDLQTQSRLSHRTGWMLEGSTGSYRNDRLYTVTTDGEVVDEPLPRTAQPDDPFVAELKRVWQGESTKLPTLEDASHVVHLIEAIEQSARSGEVICL